MRFRCVWSKTVRVITVIALLIIGFGLYESATEGHIIIFFFILLTVLYCLAFSPISIDITEDNLIVRRMYSSLVIHRKDIIAISAYKNSYSVRKFGSGGLFGYLGWFYNYDIGNYFSYATDEHNTILIITKNRKYLISCENPNELLSKFI